MVEAWRRKVVVFARLENRGENAYGTTVHISTSSNLLFSSLILKVGNNPGKPSVAAVAPLNRLLPFSSRTNRMFRWSVSLRPDRPMS